jgi:hypothetical protein
MEVRWLRRGDGETKPVDFDRALTGVVMNVGL